MNITVKKITDWNNVKQVALNTIGKKFMGNSDGIDSKWKMDVLKSEHSPIRELKFHIRLEGITRFVADQLVRHGKFQEMYMETARPDRGNKPRAEQTMDMLTNLIISASAASLIDMSQSRLCVGVVTKETREAMEEIARQVHAVEPEVAFYMVPSCVYRCGCKEFRPCGRLPMFIEGCSDLSSITSRYAAYHLNHNAHSIAVFTAIQGGE